MSFKQCNCGQVWGSREAFLSDSTVRLLGYQVDFEVLREGLFLFNHLTPQCRTTFSIPAGLFFDFYHGPIFKERLAGTEKCEGHCLRCDDLQRCPQKCECAFVREVIRIIDEWPKQSAA